MALVASTFTSHQQGTADGESSVSGIDRHEDSLEDSRGRYQRVEIRVVEEATTQADRVDVYSLSNVRQELE